LEATLRRLVLVYRSLPLNRDDKPHDFSLNLVTWSWDAAYL